MIMCVTLGTDDDDEFGLADQLNRDGRIALYVQLADLLHADIDAGKITGKLPSLEALSDEYRVARNTAAAALRLLAREGVAEWSRGHGYYAIPPPHHHD